MKRNYYQMYSSIQDKVCSTLELPSLSNRREALNFVGNTYDVFVVKNYREQEKLTLSSLAKTVVRYGRNIFYQTSVLYSVVITRNNVKLINNSGTRLNPHRLNDKILFDSLKIEWVEKLPFINLTNGIVVSIIKGLCTRPEHVFKKMMQNVGIRNKDNVSWRHFSKCIETPMPLRDILSYSENKASTIDYFAEHSFSSLDRDLLNYAIRLDQTIDFRWSERRKQEEHLKQIRMDYLENKRMSDSPIYTREALSLFNAHSPYNLELLNTEQDIFINAEHMSNCTYRCYYPKIKRGAYILFRGKYEGEIFNIGFYAHTDGSISFDQCHGRYNSYLEYTSEIKDSMKDILQSLRLLHIDKKLFITPEYEVQEIINTIDFDALERYLEDL